MTTAQLRPSARRRRAGIRPAWITDDLPLPERPIRVRSGSCADLLDEVRDLVLAAEEQAGILLAEGEQAAIGADRLAQGGAGDGLAADALEQQVELGGVVGVGAQVDPGLQLEEAAGRVGDAGQDAPG